MTNIFAKISEQNANFESLINEKGLVELVNKFDSYSKNSIIGIVSNMEENEIVEEIVLKKMTGTYSAFAKISKPNSPSRNYHCGGSPIKQVAETHKENLELFFSELYAK